MTESEVELTKNYEVWGHVYLSTHPHFNLTKGCTVQISLPQQLITFTSSEINSHLDSVSKLPLKLYFKVITLHLFHGYVLSEHWTVVVWLSLRSTSVLLCLTLCPRRLNRGLNCWVPLTVAFHCFGSANSKNRRFKGRRQQICPFPHYFRLCDWGWGSIPFSSRMATPDLHSSFHWMSVPLELSQCVSLSLRFKDFLWLLISHIPCWFSYTAPYMLSKTNKQRNTLLFD